MARTKKHKPGWKYRQDKKQAKDSVKSTAVPPDQPDPTKIPADTNTMATTSQADPLDDSTRPSKQVKTTNSDADQPPQFLEQAPADSKGQEMQTESIPGLVDQVLPEQLRPLKATCNFVTMSIISSSRIQQKVRSLLNHMAKFSFADTKGKPGVVILRAKGDVAAKMITIVEIAKREIEKARGKWWQYSGVHAEVTEPKRLQMTENSYTEEALLDWQKQKRDHVDRAENEAQHAENDPKMASEPDPTDEEDDFESMDQGAPDEETIATEESEPRQKIRSVPVIMTYMSKVPIPELKETYGEQTNA